MISAGGAQSRAARARSSVPATRRRGRPCRLPDASRPRRRSRAPGGFSTTAPPGPRARPPVLRTPPAARSTAQAYSAHAEPAFCRPGFEARRGPAPAALSLGIPRGRSQRREEGHRRERLRALRAPSLRSPFRLRPSGASPLVPGSLPDSAWSGINASSISSASTLSRFISCSSTKPCEIPVDKRISSRAGNGRVTPRCVLPRPPRARRPPTSRARAGLRTADEP